MHNIIANNPFRILGTCANSSPREIVANKAKMLAFLKVRKQFTFQLDMKSTLGEILRTSELIAAADSQLTIEADKIKAAQLWFVKINDDDKAAFALIKDNKLDEAIQQWAQNDCMSSLQNRGVLYLILGDIASATHMLSMMYDSHREEFIQAIGINHDVDYDQLVANIIATILEQKPLISFDSFAGEQCSVSWREVATSVFSQSMTQKLSDAVDQCQKLRNDGQYLQAGKDLLRVARPIILNLTKLLSSSDPQLINISDKVCNEIMTCAMKHNSYQATEQAAQEAVSLLMQASVLAKGTMTKTEFSNNIDKLNYDKMTVAFSENKNFKNIDELLEYHSNTPETIAAASDLIDEVWAPIIDFGNDVGADNETYIKMSSYTVNLALNKIITELNQLNNPNSSVTIYDYRYALNKAIGLIEQIWQMDIDEPTRQRLQDNYYTITGNNNQVNNAISGAGSSDDDGCSGSGCGYIAIIIVIIKILMAIID